MNDKKIFQTQEILKEKNDKERGCDPTRPRCCERCGFSVIPEHAHFKCSQCGWLTHCCEGGQG